jgi:hypothetical protein
MTISSNVISGRLAFLAILLLTLSVVIPMTAAQTSSGSSHEVVKVVGHLPLEGMHVNQMFVQQRDGKYFLYLHRPMKEVFAVVNVSHPDKPVLLSRNALKVTSGSQVQPPATGSVLALTVTPDAGPGQATPGAVPLPTETVQLVDMSDPKNVKTLKTFKGVTSMYPDDGRKLVYLVNEEGLWIISHRMLRPMPLCTSEDALTPFPDCQ